MKHKENNVYKIKPIATLRSPFKEKFGLPRQPGLIKSASAQVVFEQAYSSESMLDGLDGFSHIWLTFVFHHSIRSGWKEKVRPPRLGGNKKLGVLATRSPFRPNFIGQSVVALKRIHTEPHLMLEIECPDLVDGTPIIDVKPYVQYSDRIEHSVSGFADSAPSQNLHVHFDQAAKTQLAQYKEQYENLEALVTECLSYDPRPSYKGRDDNKIYGIKLYDFNIRFSVAGSNILVLSIECLD